MASDTSNIERNAEVLAASLARRHVEAKLLTAPGANPVVYGEIKTPGAKHTIVFYAHYDGQPVAPEEWGSKPVHAGDEDGEGRAEDLRALGVR